MGGPGGSAAPLGARRPGRSPVHRSRGRLSGRRVGQTARGEDRPEHAGRQCGQQCAQLICLEAPGQHEQCRQRERAREYPAEPADDGPAAHAGGQLQCSWSGLRRRLFGLLCRDGRKRDRTEQARRDRERGAVTRGLDPGGHERAGQALWHPVASRLVAEVGDDPSCLPEARHPGRRHGARHRSGTGWATLLLAEAGYRPTGVDIARGNVEISRLHARALEQPGGVPGRGHGHPRPGAHASTPS